MAKMESVVKLEKEKIPKDQMERTQELIQKFKMFNYTIPMDSKKNIEIIRD